MRLIDADALIDYIESDDSNLMAAREYQSDYIECINEMPTAYDPEKVIAALDEKSFSYYTKSGAVIDVEDAEEIIRRNGVQMP